MKYVEDVIPLVVVFAYVSVEATLGTFIKDEPILVADETDVFCVHLKVFFLLTHACKSVDDDTEQNVQKNNLDENLKTEIVRKLYEVLGILFLVVNHFGVVADAAAKKEALVEESHVALEHGFAHVFANPVRVKCVGVVVVDRLL